MAAQNRRGGCGCCGCLFAFLLLILFALILLGVGFVYFSATNKPSGIAATAAVLLPSTTFTRQTYIAARQKFNQFFADPAERRVTLSNAEVNALLADSPEVRGLTRGTAVILSQNAAEVSCSLPVDLPFLPRRFLNCAFQLRPSMHGDQLVLDISKVEEKGRALGAAEIAVVVPLMEQTLSTLNKIQGDRSVHEARIENGNLVLGR